MNMDLVNIKLSKEAESIANKFVEEYHFRDSLTFFHFAMAYAMLKHSEIDIDRLDKEYDTYGTNYNVGSIKKSSILTQIIPIFFQNCETPYRYIRVLMIYGSYELRDALNEGKSFEDILQDIMK